MSSGWRTESTYQSPTSQCICCHVGFGVSLWWTATGWPESRRAATNSPIAFLTRFDGRGPCKKIFCSVGKASVSLASRFRAGATCRIDLSCRRRSLMEVNGCKSSTHWAPSSSSFQLRMMSISRRSKVGREDNAESQTCESDESCQSDGLHEIANDDDVS